MNKMPQSLQEILRSTCLWHREMGRHLSGNDKQNYPDGALDNIVLKNP